MAKAQILSNVFGQHSAVGSTDRYNQFIAVVDGLYFITNPVYNGTTFVGFRVVDKEAVQNGETAGIYSGGTKEQRLQIISKLATYTQLGIYRGENNILQTTYVPADADINAGLKQSSPYADPFTLLAPARTANEVRLLLGLPQVDSGGNTLTGGTGTGGSGTGGSGSGANAKKSVFNTLDILTGDNTTYPTTGYDLASVQEAFDKDPVGTSLIGLGVVEVGTLAVTGLMGEAKSFIVGKVFNFPTVFDKKKSKSKRRKSSKGKDKDKKKGKKK